MLRPLALATALFLLACSDDSTSTGDPGGPGAGGSASAGQGGSASAGSGGSAGQDPGAGKGGSSQGGAGSPGAGAGGSQAGAAGLSGSSGQPGQGGAAGGSAGGAAGGGAGQGGAGSGQAGAGQGGSEAGGAGSGGAGQGGAGAGGTGAGGAGQGGASGQGQGGAGAAGATGGPPTAAALLALLGGCSEVSQGKYQTDDEGGSPASIPICGLKGAVYWQADMDIDCDGKESDACNLAVDPAYQDQTSATDSNGDPLDAAALPFVVIPLQSSRFAYDQAGLELGSVVAVIYNGKVAYGVFGDEGPENIIGEASYAMAKLLGIDPDPSTGGTDGPVTYIAFTGKKSVASPIEDHAAATKLGESLAAQLIADNP